MTSVIYLPAQEAVAASSTGRQLKNSFLVTAAVLLHSRSARDIKKTQVGFRLEVVEWCRIQIVPDDVFWGGPSHKSSVVLRYSSLLCSSSLLSPLVSGCIFWVFIFPPHHSSFIISWATESSLNCLNHHGTLSFNVASIHRSRPSSFLNLSLTLSA